MSALDELVNKKNWSFNMRGGIWRYLPEFTDPGEAAAELQALRASRAALVAALEKTAAAYQEEIAEELIINIVTVIQNAKKL